MKKRTITTIIILLILVTTAVTLVNKALKQQHPFDCQYATIFRYDGEQALTIKEYRCIDDMVILTTTKNQTIIVAKENVLLSTTYQCEDK